MLHCLVPESFYVCISLFCLKSRYASDYLNVSPNFLVFFCNISLMLALRNYIQIQHSLLCSCLFVTHLLLSHLSKGTLISPAGWWTPTEPAWDIYTYVCRYMCIYISMDVHLWNWWIWWFVRWSVYMCAWMTYSLSFSFSLTHKELMSSDPLLSQCEHPELKSKEPKWLNFLFLIHYCYQQELTTRSHQLWPPEQ